MSKDKYITLSNGSFFTVRFEKEVDDTDVHLYQTYGEDQSVYCMTLKPEQLVELIYQLEDMVDTPE